MTKARDFPCCSSRRLEDNESQCSYIVITDEVERQRILELLTEEQQKQKDAGDKIEE